MSALSALAFAVPPVGAQPLSSERIIFKINNLSLKIVSPDEAEKLAMPAKGIVLHLSDVTLAQALTELRNQSGVALNFGQGEPAMLDKKLSLDLETHSFQAAFDAIMDEAGVKGFLQGDGRLEGRRVQFGRGGDEKNSGPQSGIGLFQVQLQRVDSNFRETVQPNADGQAVRSQERKFSLSIDSRTDPTLDVIGSPLIILNRVEDDKNRSLLDISNNWLNYDFNSGWYGVRQQSFKTPSPDAKSLARIEGMTIYVVPTERKHWEMADILGNKNTIHQFDVGGRVVTFKIKRVERDGSKINLKYEMSTPTDAKENEIIDPLFSFGQMGKVIRLEDAKGQVFGVGSSGGSSSNSKIEMETEFSLVDEQLVDANGKTIAPQTLVEPVKLVFDGPVEFVQTQVPFSFENVPLP